MVNIVIWDCEGSPSKSDETIVLWRDFAENFSSDISIPSLIEEHAAEIRSTYLNWIYDLGKLSFNGKTLIQHLELHAGISFWWMLPISEKCNFSKSPHINDAIRLITFSKWARSVAPRSLSYIGPNKNLSKCIELWCKKKNILFKCNVIREPKDLALTKSIYRFLPNAAQALLWATCYIYRSWPLRNIGLDGWRASSANVTFISYLFNFNLNSANEGKFESAYWGTLPDDLLQDGLKTNWLHLYINSNEYTCAYAARTLEFFNKSSRGLQNHVALESFLSFSVVIKALIDWIRLTLLGPYLEKFIIRKLSRQNLFYLWPLFSHEWRESMAGQIAFENTLTFHLFDAALKAKPQKNLGVFLQENQGWEFSFIQVWRKISYGTLIGFPHSTVRFWDLRYHFNPKSFQNDIQDQPLPMPDIIATNGTASKRALIEGGHLAARLVDVESLRHLYLGNINFKRMNHEVKSRPPIKLLVMGDYLPSNTAKQMQLLKKVAELYADEIQITIKKHPANPFLPEICANIDHIISDDPIEKLLINCDIAFSSSVTSAAVDAYCSGTPLISVLDPNILNLSPLREQTSVYFIKNSQELISAISGIIHSNPILTRKIEYFTIDKNLPRWRQILKDYT